MPPASAIARASNCSLARWQPLTPYIADGDLPIDNNWVENRIRPIALGRKTGYSPARSARENALLRS